MATEAGMATEMVDEIEPRVGGKLAAIAVGLLAVAVLGVILAVRFADSERERDLRAWQIRLGIVADSRADAVNRWIGDQMATVTGLAENASLQLYFADIQSQGDEGPAGRESAQAGYLRNLLVVTADRTGFKGPVLGPDVPANVSRVGVAGLALTDAEGKVLAATPGMPPLTGRLAEVLAARKPGDVALFDLHVGVGGDPTIGFAAPVFAVQDDPGTSREIGLVVGIRTVGKEFYDLLEQPGDTLETSETMLVRREGPTIRYLSALRDGTPPLSRALAADTPDLAAAFAVDKPGGFAIKRDYRGTDVLVTGRALARVPWVLVRKVDAAEALAEIDARRRNLLAAFLGAILLAAVIVVAVWRHGTSVRAARAAERFRVLAERFRRLNRFLRLVTDGQPTVIAAVDAEGRYSFANRRAAAGLGIDSEEMVGKRMAAVIGPVKAKIYDRLNKRAMGDDTPVSETLIFEDEDGRHIVKSDHIPLSPEDGGKPGVLMVEQDITELVTERARRERTLRQLVTTLVAVVDRRDPFAAHHSARVAEVARAIAEEMELTATDVETIDIAAQLMNLGKCLVPKSVLTKTGKLSDEELDLIRDNVLSSADLLEGVEFDGPVVETLRQMQERWDGTGPKGLAGDDILVSARVVAVANAFVGMVSPRAHRKPLSFDEACEELRRASGTVYDRKPVSALVNRLDNRGGREAWSDFQAPPQAA